MVKKENKEKENVSIKELELRTGVKHSAIWAIAVVSVLMLIGIFFGKDGYIAVGAITLLAGFFGIQHIAK